MSNWQIKQVHQSPERKVLAEGLTEIIINKYLVRICVIGFYLKKKKKKKKTALISADMLIKLWF